LLKPFDMIGLQSRLTLHRPALLRRILHVRMAVAGQNRVSRGQNILCGIDVRMIGMAAGEAVERLAFSVLLIRVAAASARPAGVARVDED